MHPANDGRLGANSSISSAMHRISAGSTGTAKPCRMSDLIPKSWDGSHDKGQFRNFMAELHLWMQARSDQGERLLVRVGERRQGGTFNTGCRLHGSRLQNTRNRSVQGVPQDDNKRTTEDGSTSTGSERI